MGLGSRHNGLSALSDWIVGRDELNRSSHPGGTGKPRFEQAPLRLTILLDCDGVGAASHAGGWAGRPGYNYRLISVIGSNLLFGFPGICRRTCATNSADRNDAMPSQIMPGALRGGGCPGSAGNAEVTFGSETYPVFPSTASRLIMRLRNYAVVEGEFINTEHLRGSGIRGAAGTRYSPKVLVAPMV
jgi:hypothetical protein